MARHFDVADLESVAGIVARGILPRMKLASESLATEGPPAPPRRDEDVEAEDRQNAAATLFQDAVEMLEALRGLVKHAPKPKGIRADYSYTLYLEAAARAIAKAEGRTE